jgi:FtsP/CotA-like multicopper oxidase with cupredoxin domain
MVYGRRLLVPILLLAACTSQQASEPLIIVLDDLPEEADLALDMPPESDLAPDMDEVDFAQPPDMPVPVALLPKINGLIELEDINPDPDIVEVNLSAQAAMAQLQSGAKTAVLSYNGLLPGPLIHAKVGDRVIVHFNNKLDEKTLIHWHGLRISDQMDGSPMLQNPILAGESFTYDFVVPDSGTFWYHTHYSQIEQLERGLYGALVVHEANPPQFESEHLVVLDDVRLDDLNQIAPFQTSGHDVGAGRVGNALLINGTSSPLSWSIPRGSVQRWRIILASNALSYGLRTRGGVVRVIATDGGFLPQPFTLDRIEIAPGQRYELEVEAAEGAAEVVLEALILVSDGKGGVIDQPFTLASAAVVEPQEPALARPQYPAVELPAVDAQMAQLEWRLSGAVVNNRVEFTINEKAIFIPNGPMDHAGHMLLEMFTRNKPVRITIKSDVSPAHPFHFHGQFFQIVARNGAPVVEPGLRDTVEVRGRESVTIVSYFENPGEWMVHCHIAEHGENGMMADILVMD